jgi:hypothetical protein
MPRASSKLKHLLSKCVFYDIPVVLETGEMVDIDILKSFEM